MEGFFVPIRGGDRLGMWRSQSAMDYGQEVDETTPFLLMMHGGGYSGLTWAPLVDELSRLIVAEYGALDLRGHGESECKEEMELSLETLTEYSCYHYV
jgi:pimeloyl-ACP methyl ester carboxylesterase